MKPSGAVTGQEGTCMSAAVGTSAGVALGGALHVAAVSLVQQVT